MTTSTNLAGKGGLLEKMGIQPAANFRRGIRFEGLKFAAGDFLLSVAQASNLGGSKQFMGVVAEVEYIPVCSIAMAKPILEVCLFPNTIQGSDMYEPIACFPHTLIC